MMPTKMSELLTHFVQRLIEIHALMLRPEPLAVVPDSSIAKIMVGFPFLA